MALMKRTSVIVRRNAVAVDDITDRAKRYRAQHNVTGPEKCVMCGKSRSAVERAGGILDVMHLSGDESDGDKRNLAYGCRSCNTKLGAAFKRIGAGVRTRQFNPADGIPTFAQYAWAVSVHDKKTHAHDEGGAIIHATPRAKRIEYAQMIAAGRSAKRRKAREEVPF